ncbi:sigma-54 dependent transcriptional regulator [Aeromonas aquatica]|uniref:sigma-54 dependent transcriptional regulator n=1 Tax=Aeromonas aquatica TaxID=558964 RepID=UPI00286F5DD1|nr:sigma-54 dependent transcriptional regulator [Aeromonas aquatica]
MLLIESDSRYADDIMSKLSVEQASHLVRQARLPSLDELGKCMPKLVILGCGLAPQEVLAYVHQLQSLCSTLPILLISRLEHAIWAGSMLAAGVSDYLLHPFSALQLSQQVTRALSPDARQSDKMIMGSPASRCLLMLAERVAHADATVLITGETGTGKEMLAQYIHINSRRAKGPFVAINCAAIPDSMLEAILFGHTKGAFTGAHTGQAGKFEQADNGTLFLDEIAEMPPALQAKLLRVIQEREVERLGSNKVIPLNIRIIAATNQNLKEAVAQGLFREDLFYRLDVLPLAIPPLRQRVEEIESLVVHFMKKHADVATSEKYDMSPCALESMFQHDWPGNIRELENRVQRALVMCRGTTLLATDFGFEAHTPPLVRSANCSPSPLGRDALRESRKHGEYQHILDTLRRFYGHRIKAAEALGITTRALRYKLADMKQRGIVIDDNQIHLQQFT